MQFEFGLGLDGAGAGRLALPQRRDDEDVRHSENLSSPGGREEPVDAKFQVFLEMQLGDGPRAPVVARPVKIGENLTLVVRSRSTLKGSPEAK